MLCLTAVTLFALAPLQTQLGPVREVGRSATHTLWVVDKAGGGDFTTIQAAIDAAESGDAIEVRPGNYPGFVWDSKDLVVFGSGTPAPRIQNTAVIRSIGDHGTAVLRNLAFVKSSSNGKVLSLESSPGTIWLEDCTIDAFVWPTLAESRDCANVVIAHCTFKAHAFNGSLANDPTTFSSLRSTIHAYESEFRGSAGVVVSNIGTLEPPTNYPGGNAVELEESQLFASGCAFLGGPPGLVVGGCNVVQNPRCSVAVPGGIGLIVGAGSLAESLGSTIAGGPGRPAGTITCQNGSVSCPAGPAGQDFTGTVSFIPLPARDYRIQPPVTAAVGSYQLSAEGEPGWFLYSVFSDQPAGIPFPIYFGTQLTAAPVDIVYEGTIPASGVLEKDVRVPLVLGTSFAVRFAQGLLFDELANAYLTSGSVLIVR